MKKKLYSYLPSWAKNGLRDRKCNKCEQLYDNSDVEALGIKEIKEKIAFYIEQKCKNCSNRCTTVFAKKTDSCLEELCYTILDYLNHKKIKPSEDGSEHGKSTKISDHEVSEFLKYLNSNPDHNDFIKRIGGQVLDPDS